MKRKITLPIKHWFSSSLVRAYLTFTMLMGLCFMDNSYAQIAVSGTSTATTTGLVLTIPKPATVNVGDVMFASLIQSGVDNQSLSDATGTGWTQVSASNMNASNNRHRATLLYKVATAADVAATGFNFALDTESADGEGGIVAFSGVDVGGGIFDAVSPTAYTNVGSDAVLNASAITTTQANTAIVMFGAMNDDVTVGPYTAGSLTGFTEIFDIPFDATLDMNTIAAWGIKATAGSSGAVSGTMSGTANNGAVLVALKRFTGAITTGVVPTSLCAGSSVSVPFTVSGSTFASGNVFTAQLSDAAGSFATPTNIGTLTGTTSGSISATIPAGAVGTGYRIRVVSSLTAATGSINASNISISAPATAVAGSNISICETAGAINITAGSSATNNSGILWTSSGTGTFADANSLTLATYTPSAGDISAGGVTLTLTASATSPCANAVSTKTLTIFALPTTVNTVICQGGTGFLTSTSFCPVTASTTQGPNAATSGANSTAIGTVAWLNPGNIVTAGSPYATAATNASISNYLVGSTYGFNIPAGSVIGGIQVSINRMGSSVASGNGVFDSSVRLLKAGTAVGSNLAVAGNYPTSLTVANYGGASNLWGTTWTATEINNANFGVALAVTSTVSRTASVDYIRVTVTYSPPGSLNWYTVASGGTPIGSGYSFNPVGVANSGLADTQTPGTTTFYAECAVATGCRTATTFTINPLPTVSFTGLDASYCGNDNAVTLTGNETANSLFTGAGITDNGNGTASFNPATAGAGTHTITYTYTNGNGCVNNATKQVTVIAPTTYYADADEDGFGDINTTELSCDGPSEGFVANNTDCDDTDAAKNTTFPFYADTDNDGFGAGDLVAVCAVDANTPPDGYVLNGTDCDASNGSIWQSGPLFIDVDNDGYTSGSTGIVCYGNTAPSGYALTNIGIDCNDAVFAINPGHAEVLYNGVDDNCDNNLDEGFQYTTQIKAEICGTTLSTINSYIVAYSMAHVTAHRFEVTNVETNQVVILERTQNYFSPTMLSSYNYAETYSVRVEIQRDGVWLGYYGPACLVSTPNVLQPGGLASIVPTQCGNQIATISTLIATTSLANVTGYRFRVTNASDITAPNQVQTIDRGSLHWFSLPMLTTFNYGTTYLIEVAVRTNGVYSDYGSPCAVTSPSVPMLNMCGQTIPTKGTLISAASLNRVTSYRFEITNLLNNQVTMLDRTQNWFTFNNVPGFNPGGEYSVRVAIMTSGVYSPFGEACTIVAPAAARTTEQPFAAAAYPNPFADSFSINVQTASEENFSVKVYDMMGRLIDSKEADLLEMQSLKVGDNYPSGIYNVILTQGNQVETLRVIKR